MKKHSYPLGTVCVAPIEEIFAEALNIAIDSINSLKGFPFSWALSGGSTPQKFYRYLLETASFESNPLTPIRWFTSDERVVPLASEESNFGHLDRGLLKPLEVLEEHKFPWPTDLHPADAAALYEKFLLNLHGSGKGFDLCFLGMGNDGHTASIFPGSPLLKASDENIFASVEVPGKGMRLTITPYGLSICGKIVLIVTGKDKAVVLNQVLNGIHQPNLYPVQILADYSSQVTWLVDKEAASEL